MRILIIEDDQDLCRFIALALEQSECAFDICHTGNDGLFFAKNRPSFPVWQMSKAHSDCSRARAIKRHRSWSSSMIRILMGLLSVCCFL